MKKRPQSEEIKIQAIMQITVRGRKMVEVSARIGVSQHSLYRWIWLHGQPPQHCHSTAMRSHSRPRRAPDQQCACPGNAASDGTGSKRPGHLDQCVEVVEVVPSAIRIAVDLAGPGVVKPGKANEFVEINVPAQRKRCGMAVRLSSADAPPSAREPDRLDQQSARVDAASAHARARCRESRCPWSGTSSVRPWV